MLKPERIFLAFAFLMSCSFGSLTANAQLLGLGPKPAPVVIPTLQPPQPSWGLMIKENYNFIITHNPMLALAPGLAIMLLVLAFNLLGNGLRDVLNVRV